MSVSSECVRGSAGPGFDASGIRLHSAQLRITAALDDARQSVAAVETRAADVLDGWVGGAGAAYAAAFARWREGAERVLLALADSAAGLERAARDYDTAETAGRDMLVGLVR